MAPKHRSIKCTFDNCFANFNSKKQMRAHKRSAPEHEYCHICDLDFADWDPYMAHMTDVDDARKDNQHICCRYCGFVFSTREARDKHVTHAHPVAQKIPCRACGEIFYKPSSIIHHLENDWCPNYGAEDFYAQVQHKLIIKELLDDPRKLALLNGQKWIDAARDDDEIEGGVSLMENSTGASLLPDSGVLVPKNADKAGGVHIRDQDFPTLLESVADAETKTKVKEFHGPGPLLHPRRKPPVIKKKADVVPVGEKTDADAESNPTPVKEEGSLGNTAPPARPPNPWNIGGPSSKIIGPSARATPAVYAWMAKAKEVECNSTNLMHTQFWNPDSKDYDPYLFFDPIVERFGCPMPGCSSQQPSDTDLTTHLYEKHRAIEIACPACRKEFKQYYQLIAHFESGSEKCGIFRSDFFERIMDDYTGGFVDTTTETRPDNKSLEYHKFEGGTPLGFEERLSVIQIGGQRTGDPTLVKRRGA